MSLTSNKKFDLSSEVTDRAGLLLVTHRPGGYTVFMSYHYLDLAMESNQLTDIAYLYPSMSINSVIVLVSNEQWHPL